MDHHRYQSGGPLAGSNAAHERSVRVQPYDRLKKALHAEIDEAAWDTLYATVLRPFPRPASGRIAVKVISHYGDEVLSVHEV